jgi:hypothetical protein
VKRNNFPAPSCPALPYIGGQGATAAPAMTPRELRRAEARALADLIKARTRAMILGLVHVVEDPRPKIVF